MLPVPKLLSKITFPPRVIARKKEMVPFVVVIFAAIELAPVPSCVNEPLEAMRAPDGSVKAPPLLVILTGPVPVVVTGLLNVIEALVR